MKLAIFDFDGTLFPKETVPFIVIQYGKLGYSRIKQARAFVQIMGILASYKLKLDKTMNKEKFRSNATQITLSLFEGMTEHEVGVFFEKLNRKVLMEIDKDVLKELDKHKTDGFKVVLLSGGFMPLIGPVGKKLGVDHVIGTELNYRVNTNGDRIIQPFEPINLVTGDNKTRELDKYYGSQNVDWEKSYAYADSVYDAGVMEKVGNPVGVNPDLGLQAICNENKWTVLKTEAGAELDKKTISSK